MCGRFVYKNTSKEIKFLFPDFIDRRNIIRIKKYNIVPSTSITVIRSREVVNLTWGFTFPGVKKPVINARQETVFEKPLFKDSIIERRCLIPADGWIEWKAEKKKKPYYIYQDKTLFFAGIYKNGLTCILTTEADKSIEHIHHRMPMVMPYERVSEWLGAKDKKTIEHLLNNSNKTNFKYHPINPAINSPKVESKDFLEPYEETGLFGLMQDLYLFTE